MARKFYNNVRWAINSDVSPGDTVIKVLSNNGITLSGSDYIVATIVPAGGLGSMEIVTITNISGSTFTVVRGQEGTTPQYFLYGSVMEIRITASALDNIEVPVDTLRADLESTDPSKGASMVGYKAPWLGSVASNTYESNYRIMDIRDFGVKPNITNDYSAEIQAALDATFAEQLILNIPGGMYYHDYPLVVNTKAKIRGAGSFFTQFVKTSRSTLSGLPTYLADGPSGTIIDLNGVDACIMSTQTADKEYVYDLDFSGITFGAEDGQQSYRGIWLPVAALCRMSDVTMKNCEYGFEANDMFMSSFELLRGQRCKYGIAIRRFTYVGQPTGESNAGTSLSFNSCWGHDCTEAGWLIDGLNYSSMNACGSDNNKVAGRPQPSMGFRISNTRHLTLNGCGSEGIRGGVFDINNSTVIMNGVSGKYGVTSDASMTSTPIVYLTGSSDVTMVGCSFNATGDTTKLTPLRVSDDSVLRHSGGTEFLAGTQTTSENGKIYNLDRQCIASVRFTVSGGTVTIVDQYRVVSVTRTGTGAFSVVYEEGDWPATPTVTTGAYTVRTGAMYGTTHTFVCANEVGVDVDPSIVTWSC